MDVNDAFGLLERVGADLVNDLGEGSFVGFDELGLGLVGSFLFGGGEAELCDLVGEGREALFELFTGDLALGFGVGDADGFGGFGRFGGLGGRCSEIGGCWRWGVGGVGGVGIFAFGEGGGFGLFGFFERVRFFLLFLLLLLLLFTGFSIVKLVVSLFLISVFGDFQRFSFCQSKFVDTEI